MGRNTLELLPNLLPNRKHIVLTHQEIELNPDIIVFHTMENLLNYVESLNTEVMVIGGAQIYQQMIKYANKMLLARIEQSAPADACFPTFNQDEWCEEILSETTYQNIPYKHLVYTRK